MHISLATPRLQLREMVEDDWRALYAWESRPDHVLYVPYEALTEQRARAYVQGIVVEARQVPRTVFDLAITERGGDGTMVGRVGMRRKPDELRMGMLWWSMNPSHRGQGYIHEAAAALIEYAFTELSLHRVYAEIDPRNTASVRVAERLGLRREAHMIDDIWIKGEWCSTYVYAQLAREWWDAGRPN